MSFKYLLLLLIAFLAYKPVLGQTASETLQYINTTVNSEADQTTRMQGQTFTYKVTADGMLLVKLIHRDGRTLDTRTYYLKTLCNDQSCAEIESRPAIPELHALPVTWLTITSTSGKILKIGVDSEDAAKRIKNAIFHLVSLAKANRAYKGKDPFDY
jgi:hypothetical protein